MNNVFDIYSCVLKEYLSLCFSNKDNINPIELNQERFKTKAVFMAAFLFLKHNVGKKKTHNIVFEASHWLINMFSCNNLFSSIITNAPEDLIKLTDNSFRNMIGMESVDAAALYEALLSIETKNENKGIDVSRAKNYRNKLGGYYTPVILAKSVTEITIDAFFERNYGIKNLSVYNAADFNNINKNNFLNDIASLCFADFSCGGGIFIIEIIEYFEKIFYHLNMDIDKKTELLKTIALNISAFDVDCIALEIAKLNLLLKIKQPSVYDCLKDKYIHANFLLQTDSIVSKPKKLNVFSSGYIYHEQLVLNRYDLNKYDVILGNPPWEKIRFEEKAFYSLYSSGIANIHFKASRTSEITKTEGNNAQLAKFTKQYKYELEKAKIDIKRNPFFNLSNKGELNTYALFTEAAVKLKTIRGFVGLVLKSAIVTSQINCNLFRYLIKNNLIVSIYDFINQKKVFNIDSRERFCFLLIGNSCNKKIRVSMNLNSINDIQSNKPEIELTSEDLELLSPLTGMLPNISTKEDANFLLRISHDFSFFKDVYNDVKFGRIVHLTSHAEYISKKKDDSNIPIYEGKFFNQFDGKYSGFNGVDDNMKYGNKSSSVILDEAKKENPNYLPESRYFIKKDKWLHISKSHNARFMLVWRSLTSATNTRTCIATLLPFIPALQSVQFLTTNENDLLYLTGLYNSVVFDFILKKRLSGIDLTQSVLKQVPVPTINYIDTIINFNGHKATIKQHISLLVFYLLRNDYRLNLLFKSLGLDKEQNTNDSRFNLIRKIDLLFMLLYKLNRSELKLVLTPFSKQYSNNDINYFTEELDKLRSDNSISSACTAFSTSSPCGRIFN